MPESSTQPVVPAELREFLARERERVDTALDAVVPAATTPPTELHEGMRHAVFAGGKRLRPLLVIAGANACGAAADEVMAAACAVELIHTYSLVHDDLPAFDDEELRRGQPTCHVLWGEAEAILVGDALQALALEHLAAAGCGAPHPERWLRALETIGRAAGSTGMCGGQMMDIHAAGAELEVSALRQLHAAKTGALLTGSVVSGAVLAGAPEQQLERLHRYGVAVGLAFQMVDDLLDIEGTAEELGKRPGGDADRQQPTFPSLIGAEATRLETTRLHDEALSALDSWGAAAEPLRMLAGYIVRRSN